MSEEEKKAIRKPRKPIDSTELREIVIEWQSGKHICDIAKTHDRAETTITRVLKDVGVWFDESKPRVGVNSDVASWFKEHGWDWEQIGSPSNRKRYTEDGTRIVYTGEKGIRTPFRPDGIWR